MCRDVTRHGRLKRLCSVCNPCPHGKRKANCSVCNGCVHGKVKYNCGSCNPCPHGRLKRHCATCEAEKRSSASAVGNKRRRASRDDEVEV